MMEKLKRFIPVLLLFLLSSCVHNGQEAYRRGDYKTAFEKIKPLAERGDAIAQYNLGVMYAEGQGVPQDYKESFKWYRLSADQGMAKAQFNLGVMCSKGQGVLQDYVQAYKWFNLPGVKDDKDAVHNRNIIEKRMTSDQIAEAQRLAREWMERHRKK